MRPTPIIKLTNVCFSYKGYDRNVLNHLDLTIMDNEKIGMIARNGCGKTTLLHTIMGLCRPISGRIEIFGKQLRHEKDFIPVRSKIGLLFQNSDDQLFCPTVLDDVAFGPLNLGYPPADAVSIAQDMLEKLGIRKLDQQITHRLSGGQKRLVAFAAVLAMEPEVLLLDEPTAGLDHGAQKKLITILNNLDISCFIISHEFDFIRSITDKIFSMENGRVLTGDDMHIHRHEHIHKHGKHPHDHP